MKINKVKKGENFRFMNYETYYKFNGPNLRFSDINLCFGTQGYTNPVERSKGRGLKDRRTSDLLVIPRHHKKGNDRQEGHISSLRLCLSGSGDGEGESIRRRRERRKTFDRERT